MNVTDSRQRLEPTERDRKLLRALHTSRVASALQLAAITGEAFNQGLIRRLQKLHQYRLVDRPRQQAHYRFGDRRQFQGKRPLVYALGDAGADYLAGLGEIERGRIRWQAKNAQIKELQIQHAMATTNLRACLYAALPPGSNPYPYHWDQGRHLKSVFYSDRHGELAPRGQAELRHVVVPDAFFALDVESRGRRHGEYYMVETDRSTMDHGRMLRKYRDYFLLWRFGLHSTQYHGIDRFRVLTITKSRERRDNLCALSRGADDKGKGSRLFLFLSEDDFSIEKPERLLDPCAVNPVESKPQRLW